jgi:GNAT superfamily N-acetyltransferase
VEELDGQRGGALLAGTLVRSDPMQSLRVSLHDPDRLLVAGLIDEVTVGLASAVCDRERREPVARLELIYVEAPARQVGVAEAMVEVVLDWGRRLRCAGVDAPALPGNRTAKAFFETHGFLARLLVMHFPLDPPS